jgi:hypothetical protein
VDEASDEALDDADVTSCSEAAGSLVVLT